MWKLKAYDKEKEHHLLDKGINRLMSRLLASRDVSVEGVEEFMDAKYESIADPYSLNGLKEGVDIFCQAVLQKKKIAVIGDYDADGVISSAMFRMLCKALDYDCDVFLPNRLEHGYGLNSKTIEAFQEKHADDIPYLLVALDCGINNNDEIEELKMFGVERVVVIDHHIYDDKKLSRSADALINWRMSDKEEMCTCGELYQFIRGVAKFTKKVNPMEFLSYAAIGTIADVTPIQGDNRIMVRHGLDRYALDHVVPAGLDALMRQARVYAQNVTQQDIAFRVVPRINAAGRLQDPLMAHTMLVEPDNAMADLMAENLDECNSSRKQLQRSIEKEAIRMVNDIDHPHGILLYNPNWHIGVVGIVASRVVDEFKKPTLIFGNHNGVIKGSGRSLTGIHLPKIMEMCKSVFEKYGGHDLAVGATLKEDRFTEANALFNEACRKYYFNTSVKLDDTKYYDAELRPQSVTPELIRMLKDNLYPYCNQSNPEPIFLLSDVVITNVEVKEGEGWQLLRFDVTKDGSDALLPMMMFSSDYGSEIKYKTADIYFKLPQGISKYSEANVVDIVFK